MNFHKVRFPGQPFEELLVEEGTNLSVALDATNSPALFGCRTGLCGTCALIVRGELSPPDEDEVEVLEVYADGAPGARLACQIEVRSELEILPLEGRA